MKIPDDMYEKVFGLATELVNASEGADKKSYCRLYTELREYCEAESRSGREHPFLWETLGDFTTDDQTAIDLYLKALERARSAGSRGYEASILLALAERCSAIGDSALAYKYALEANKKAEVLDDLDLRRSISEFLLGESARQP